jgi:hypothetical protein
MTSPECILKLKITNHTKNKNRDVAYKNSDINLHSVFLGKYVTGWNRQSKT